MNVAERFLKYVAIDTQSDPDSETYPSTAKQLRLLNLLLEEMLFMGIADACIDEYGYVTGTIPSTTDVQAPVIAFIAHVDTSPDVSGFNVKPQVIRYDGGNLPEGMIVDDKYIGHTLITTDGTTLLGADDKAGVAEIMTAAECLMANPQIEHCEIKILFTPDEEVGRGVDYFNVDGLGADFGYTVDGGEEGELEYENFNAASVKITIKGHNVHPGYAKDKMINASRVAMEIDSMLPSAERPETTQGYEGFYHLIRMEGNTEDAFVEYIIRDHDKAGFASRKSRVVECVNRVNLRYGNIVRCDIADQYYNMREIIESRMQVVDIAAQAMRELGIEPVIKPIRGGTDGSRLSFMGLPCPNIFAGGVNFHSRYEFVSQQVMERATKVIVRIAQLATSLN